MEPNESITTLMLNQISEIEERDNNQILAELAGETLDEYVYDVVTYDRKAKKEKRTVKLSWVGTREMMQVRGNIAMSGPDITDQDGYIRMVIRATDLKRNVSVFGGIHQLKTMKVKTYDEHGKPLGEQLQDDPFYFQKALSKAQRNAIQAVMPASFIAKMIDRFLLSAGKQPRKQLAQPKPAPKPRVAKDLPDITADQITTLFDLEKLAFNRWHIQPAKMYQELGYSSKVDVTEPPFECFLRLRAIFEP